MFWMLAISNSSNRPTATVESVCSANCQFALRGSNVGAGCEIQPLLFPVARYAV